MTLFHLHDEFAAAGESRLTAEGASAWLPRMLKIIHEAIVAARTRRLQRELIFHADPGDEGSEDPVDERDVRRIPQRPMILGDKWDF